ncbi:hypothetical protein CPC08DRAFT_729065 [Agrocybe pediades]|nr:hypothetical protein CPC08DRAFT_729065 [Agrocybe pediades]
MGDGEIGMQKNAEEMMGEKRQAARKPVQTDSCFHDQQDHVFATSRRAFSSALRRSLKGLVEELMKIHDFESPSIILPPAPRHLPSQNFSLCTIRRGRRLNACGVGKLSFEQTNGLNKRKVHAVKQVNGEVEASQIKWYIHPTKRGPLTRHRLPCKIPVFKRDPVKRGAQCRQLSILQVSDENVLAFMGSFRAVLSTLPSDVMLSEDLVFQLYARGHVCKIDYILKNLSSKQSYAVEEPDDYHTRPFTTHSSSRFRTSEAIEYVRRNTVAELIRVQQRLLNVAAGANPIQEAAWVLNYLAVDLSQLEMYSESLTLRTWSVDLYKTFSISNRDVYGPYLALACFQFACTSYRTGGFAQAMAMTTESLSLLKTCNPTFAMKVLTACVLSESAYFRRAIGEQYSASLQDAEESVAVLERPGVDQMAVIGPQLGGNFATFGLHLTGTNGAVQNYAYSLDAQRKFLYKSKRYQEAVDMGESALRLYRALAQCYKHLWSNDNITSVSEALTYAEEAVRIWEKVHEVTGASEEDLLDSFATQTKILVEVGRPSDALTVFQKLANAYANYLAEALLYSDEALAGAGQQLMKDAAFTEQYLKCLSWAAFLSIEDGYPQRAINQIQDALNTLCPSSGYEGIRLELIAWKALAYLRLGQLSPAAATATEGYDSSQSTNLQEEEYYGELLHVSALVHR